MNWIIDYASIDFFFPLSLPSSLSLPTHPPPLAGPPTAHYTPLLPSRPIADWGGVSIESLLIGLNADRLKALSLFSLSSLSHAGGLELHGGFRKESELLAQFVGGDGLVFFILTLRTDTHCSTVYEQVAVLAFQVIHWKQGLNWLVHNQIDATMSPEDVLQWKDDVIITWNEINIILRACTCTVRQFWPLLFGSCEIKLSCVRCVSCPQIIGTLVQTHLPPPVSHPCPNPWPLPPSCRLLTALSPPWPCDPDRQGPGVTG